MDEAVQCYSICIQLQFRAPSNPLVARAVAANPQAAAAQQAQRLSVAYNNLGGILKLQVPPLSCFPSCASALALHSHGTTLHARLCQVVFPRSSSPSDCSSSPLQLLLIVRWLVHQRTHFASCSVCSVF